MGMRVQSVLIVGGGIAGISLAIALREHGIVSRIVEKRAKDAPQGAALHLPGNAVGAAAKLGIHDALRQRAYRFPRIEYTDHKGLKLATLDLARRYGPTASWPAFYSLHRETFRDILLDRVGGIPIEFECEVEAVGRDKQGIGVTLTNGEVECPDLVVGADGIRSSMRETQFGPQFVPVDMGYACWRFIASCPDGLEAPEYMLGNRRTFLAMPIDGERAYVYAMICDTAHRGDSDLSGIFRDFGGYAPHLLERLDPSTVISGRLHQVALDKWSAGPVVLIGDAAHATPPTIAQGAAMAMEDALVLAECLGRAQGTLDEQLATFEARRRNRVLWVQNQSVKRLGAAVKAGAMVQKFRNILMRTAGTHMLKSGWAPLIEKPF